MICTDGSDDAQATPRMVALVTLLPASLSSTRMSKGAPPLQVTSTQASVLAAVTATHDLPPATVTQKLLAAAPRAAGKLTASPSLLLVWPQTWNLPLVRSLGPRNWPSVGFDTVRLGGVVSTG